MTRMDVSSMTRCSRLTSDTSSEAASVALLKRAALTTYKNNVEGVVREWLW